MNGYTIGMVEALSWTMLELKESRIKKKIREMRETILERAARDFALCYKRG